MTVIINIGRRVPKSWLKRHAHTLSGLLSFQENMWIIIKSSFNMSRKKANAGTKCKYIISYEMEDEDLNYNLQWMKVVIQSTEAIEQEEFDIAQRLYQPLRKNFQKEIPNDTKMKSHFKTKILNFTEVDEAYKKGYGALDDSSISQKLLDMGILTHMKKIDDYNSRDIEIKPDF